MTILDLLFLTAVTVGMLILAALTPPSYRLTVYIILAVGWAIVLLYLVAPPGTLDRQLPHWMS